jgi:uncharacterized 2Fe-2S/4Fe-4S cluster protein (DUF4445 family)
MSDCTVTFEPGHRTVTVDEGTTLADAAACAGIHLPMSCGGQGLCGKCGVSILTAKGRPADAASGPSQQGRGEDGWVLACQEIVNSDLVVDVSRAERIAAQLDEGVSDGDVRDFQAVPRGDGRPLVRTVVVRMSPPSVQSNATDLSRLRRALRQVDPVLSPVTIGLKTLQTLPTVLRRNQFQVAVTVADQGETVRIVSVTEADARRGGAAAPASRRARAGDAHPLAPVHGVAIDIGTSTVAVQLVDTTHALSLGTAVRRNAQAQYGEDVISRIIRSEEHPTGLADLRAAVLDTINDLLRQATRSAGIHSKDIMAASIAGNATMTSFLLGIDAAAIRRAPHVPAASDLPVFTGEEVGLRMNPAGAVYLHPGVSGFVGGDITAGVLATGMDETKQLSLLIDVGTNGEIVVGSSEWLSCCSCSAGPAFEGVGIEAGMQASRGAIEQVHYDAESDTLDYRVIGKAAPVGICGTGLLETLAALFEAGVLDRSGLFNESFPTERLRRGEYQHEFVLVRRGEHDAKNDIVLTQADVGHLIRSKAAVHAGITVLLRAVGLQTERTEKVYIAGAFGAHLNLPAAVTIGMIPDIPAERIEYAGNSSLRGACASLVSKAARDRMRRIARGMTYIELSGDPTFMDEYVASMFLPHTDLSRFPSAVGLASARNGGRLNSSA